MTKDRLDIGRQVYERLPTKEEATRKYGADEAKRFELRKEF